MDRINFILALFATATLIIYFGFKIAERMANAREKNTEIYKKSIGLCRVIIPEEILYQRFYPWQIKPGELFSLIDEPSNQRVRIQKSGGSIFIVPNYWIHIITGQYKDDTPLETTAINVNNELFEIRQWN